MLRRFFRAKLLLFCGFCKQMLFFVTFFCEKICYFQLFFVTLQRNSKYDVYG